MIQFFRSDTDAVILNAAHDESAALLESDDDGFVLTAEFDGIGEQVGNHLFDLVLVAVDDEVCRSIQMERIAFLFLHDPVGIEDHLRCFCNVEIMTMQSHFTGLHAGNGQKIVDQPVQTSASSMITCRCSSRF